MPSQPRTPVPERPVTSYPTPIITDNLVVDYTPLEVGSAQNLPYGTPFDDVSHAPFSESRPTLELVFKEPVDQNGWWERRWWVNPRTTSQNSYNFSLTYSGDDPDYDIYNRIYLVKRAEYTAEPILSPDPANPDALLVSEQMLNQSNPEQASSLYVTVQRSYEVLPGPWLPFTRYDDDLGPIQGMRRAVVNTGQAASLTPTEKTTYEARNGSAIVSWEIVESWTDGGGGSGNPPFPIQVSETWDDLKGSVHTTKQVVELTGTEEATLTISMEGLVTKTWYEPYNQYLLTKYIQTWTIPGPLQYDLEYPYGGMQTFPRIITKKLVPRDAFSPSAPGTACPVAGFTSAVQISQKPDAFDPVSDVLTIVYDVIPVATDQDGFGYSVSYMEGNIAFPEVLWKFRIALSVYSPETPLSACPIAGYTATDLVEQTQEGDDAQNQIVSVTRRFQTLPGPEVVTQDFDEALNVMVYTTRQIVLGDDIFDPTDELLTLAMRESPITAYTKLRIWSYLLELPDSFTESNTGRFNFPGLVYDITLEMLQLTLDPDRSQVRWFPDQKSAPQVPAIFQTTTSYYTSPPAGPALYAIAIRDLIYNGVSFGINIGNVLNDEITVSVTFADDDNYGDLSESHTFAATTPSASTYSGNIGTFQIVAYDIKRFRGSLWVLQSTSVLLI